VLGFIVLISGLASLATLIGVAQAYVIGGALVLLAIGVFFAAASTRTKEPA
jgi:hypothetical protein